MAIGLALMLGIRFEENFQRPYVSRSITEFWRRWHISLSQWLRDYLYKPLGGSRHGRLMTYRNLMATMLLGGLWHGAAWTFVFWGALHGAGLVVERLWRNWRGSVQTGRIARVLAWFATFHVVCIGWILFRSQSFSAAGDYFAGLAHFSIGTGIVTAFSVALIAIGMVFQFVPGKLLYGVVGRFAFAPVWAMALAFAAALVAIDLIAPPGTAPFIYFQF